jgi:hypothetical protein
VLDIKTEMLLLISHGLCEASPKRSGSIRKTQEHECHKLQSKELMIGKKMQDPSPLKVVKKFVVGRELMSALEIRLGSWAV